MSYLYSLIFGEDETNEIDRWDEHQRQLKYELDNKIKNKYWVLHHNCNKNKCICKHKEIYNSKKIFPIINFK